jgi:uncharacterized protein
MSDEIIMIHRDTATLELGPYLYEFIALAVPMKKLHPKFQNETWDEEEENAAGKLVYTSETKSDDGTDDDDATDPRWDILKKLK